MVVSFQSWDMSSLRNILIVIFGTYLEKKPYHTYNSFWAVARSSVLIIVPKLRFNHIITGFCNFSTNFSTVEEFIVG